MAYFAADRVPVHFIWPATAAPVGEALLASALDDDYPYWLGGAVNWVVQTYKILRQYRENLTIGSCPLPSAINIAHVTAWRDMPARTGELRVSIRADYRRLFDVDFEILQNPMGVISGHQIYLPYWPVPGLLPRDSSRRRVKAVAYAGRVGHRNLAAGLHGGDDSKRSGLQFRIIDKERWHDMRTIDVLLAIRQFSRRTFDDKPPSKLLNAWHAGIPLIAGYDSAYSAVGTPGVDYIRVGSEAEMDNALERLRDDPVYYRGIVEAGRIRSRDYTRDRIAEAWLRAVDGPIRESWNQMGEGGLRRATRLTGRRSLDWILDTASTAKAGLRALATSAAKPT